MKLKDSKVLVTGADGFIGSHMTDRLIREGADVSVLLEPAHTPLDSWKGRVRVYTGDLADRKSLDGLPADTEIVFHLAAYVHKPERTAAQKKRLWAVNAEGTENLIMAMPASLRQVIYFSTIGVYDGLVREEPFDEESEVLPISVYGRSKLEAESVVIRYGRKNRFNSTVLRLPFVYGPGNKGYIQKMIAAVDRGRFILIGKGENKRNPVYVGTVVDAAVLAAANDKAAGKTYIVTDGRDYTLREMYVETARALGRRPFPFYVPFSVALLAAKIGDVVGKLTKKDMPFNSEILRRAARQMLFSSDKIRRELGFTPSEDFHSRIDEVIEWYRSKQAWCKGTE